VAKESCAESYIPSRDDIIMVVGGSEDRREVTSSLYWGMSNKNEVNRSGMDRCVAVNGKDELAGFIIRVALVGKEVLGRLAGRVLAFSGVVVARVSGESGWRGEAGTFE